MQRLSNIANILQMEPSQLNSLLISTRGLVAGSSALYEYLCQQKERPTWKPNDVDIWIPLTGLTLEALKKGKAHNSIPTPQYREFCLLRDYCTLFLEKHGFQKKEVGRGSGSKSSQVPMDVYLDHLESSQHIHNIKYFTKKVTSVCEHCQVPSTQEIQVQLIFTNDFRLVPNISELNQREAVQAEENNVLGFLRDFDFTICSIGYDQTYAPYVGSPEDVRNKVLRLNDKFTTVKKERLAKYQKRGFVWHEDEAVVV